MLPTLSAVAQLLPVLVDLVLGFVPVVVLTILGIVDWRAAAILQRLQLLGDV